jgi:hypothetical protein
MTHAAIASIPAAHPAPVRPKLDTRLDPLTVIIFVGLLG